MLAVWLCHRVGLLIFDVAYSCYSITYKAVSCDLICGAGQFSYCLCKTMGKCVQVNAYCFSYVDTMSGVYWCTPHWFHVSYCILINLLVSNKVVSLLSLNEGDQRKKCCHTKKFFPTVRTSNVRWISLIFSFDLFHGIYVLLDQGTLLCFR